MKKPSISCLEPQSRIKFIFEKMKKKKFCEDFFREYAQKSRNSLKFMSAKIGITYGIPIRTESNDILLECLLDEISPSAS